MKSNLKHFLLKAFKSNYRDVDFLVFEIVAEGLIAHEFMADGRPLPTIMIDTLENKTVPDLIKYHQDTLPGDTILHWGRNPDNMQNLMLHIKFTKPMVIEFGISLTIEEHFGLIEGIIQSRGLILMTGKKGNKVSNLDIPRISVEVPFMNFDKIWNRLLRESLTMRLRKFGASRNEAEEISEQQINSIREVWRFQKSDVKGSR